VYVFLFIAYGCLVTLLSLVSFPLFSDVSVGLDIPHLDKAVHFAFYFIFTLLGHKVAESEQRFLYLCTGIVIFSGLIEVAQSFTPVRMMSGADFVANMLGVLLAYVMLRLRSLRRQAI
jgi:VanZ family protein